MKCLNTGIMGLTPAWGMECLITMFFCCPECLILDTRSATAYVSKAIGNRFYLCFCDLCRNSRYFYRQQPSYLV
jgi:hypothetical protein